MNRITSFLFAGSVLAAATALAPAVRAADIGVPRTAIAEAIVAPAYDWTGLYIGAHAGYRFGGGHFNEFNNFYYTNGVTVGPYAGFNWQVSRVVFGIEADWGWSSNTLVATSFIAGQTVDQTGMGSVRSRLGYAIDRFMIYGTAGVVFANYRFTPGPGPGLFPASRLHTGWIAGLGVEAMITPNLVARLEYLRFDPGSRTYNIGIADFQADIRPGNIVRVGLAYKFSWGGASAVVARY